VPRAVAPNHHRNFPPHGGVGHPTTELLGAEDVSTGVLEDDISLLQSRCIGGRPRLYVFHDHTSFSLQSPGFDILGRHVSDVNAKIGGRETLQNKLPYFRRSLRLRRSHYSSQHGQQKGQPHLRFNLLPGIRLQDLPVPAVSGPPEGSL